MNQRDQENNVSNSEDISITDILLKLNGAINYLKKKWLLILVWGIVGGVLGFVYSISNKPTYTAVCTFVLEDAKSGGGLGQYAGLASLAGINVGDDGGGIFEGDNILELYKSRTMIEKALLSACNFNGKKQLLINRFIETYKLREKSENNDKLKVINFNGNPDNFSRKQDSIITSLVDLFNGKILNVSKPDKKLSIIKVEVTTNDELFSKYFTEMLVQNVNDFYVQTKSKKAYQNVQILQHQADSVKTLLNSSIYSVASAIDAAPNANPQMSALRVPSQKKQIEVQANAAIYSEMVKNLELAKISLRQEIPLIQVIDKPVLPLQKLKISKINAIIVGGLLADIIIIIFFCLIELYNKLYKIVRHSKKKTSYS
jgi:hypothetical protein